MKTWTELAKISALASGELRSTVASRILSSLSITLHRENARAILRRAPHPAGTSCALDAAAVTLAGAAAEVASESA